MDWKAHPSFDAHEDVIAVGGERAGFAGFIAIHSTALGPAAGGCRIWDYDSGAQGALTDVMRLSRGMTYKNAMAELPLGGGKAVIYRMNVERVEAFQKFGEAVEALHGRYITAEDVGASVADMRAVAGRTAFVAGLPREAGQAGGDPSVATALGVYVSILALLGGSARGKRVALQGVGSVGFKVCEHLARDGARLVIADVNKANLARAEYLGAEIAPVDQIHAVEADLFSPCALGAGLSAQTIPELGAPLVCGAANNQLATEEDGARLEARGVTYAPDYVVNAGGIINVSAEYLGEPAGAVEARVRAIAPRLMRVLESAKSQGVTPHQAADRIVRERLAAAKKERA
jgi:leucine dehydrogenase